MGRSESFDWLPRYRAVLVATAVRAIRNMPPAMVRSNPAVNGRAWQGASFGDGIWRAVAIAAGAVPKDGPTSS